MWGAGDELVTAQSGTQVLGPPRELRVSPGRKERPCGPGWSEGLPGPGKVGWGTEADHLLQKRTRPGPLALEKREAHLATVSPGRGPVLCGRGAGHWDKQRGPVALPETLLSTLMDPLALATRAPGASLLHGAAAGPSARTQSLQAGASRGSWSPPRQFETPRETPGSHSCCDFVPSCICTARGQSGGNHPGRKGRRGHELCGTCRLHAGPPDSAGSAFQSREKYLLPFLSLQVMDFLLCLLTLLGSYIELPAYLKFSSRPQGVSARPTQRRRLSWRGQEPPSWWCH